MYVYRSGVGCYVGRPYTYFTGALAYTPIYRPMPMFMEYKLYSHDIDESNNTHNQSYNNIIVILMLSLTSYCGMIASIIASMIASSTMSARYFILFYLYIYIYIYIVLLSLTPNHI